jgi:hypothetical protein
MFTGIICAHKPWFGPELICPQTEVREVGQVVPMAVPGITE